MSVATQDLSRREVAIGLDMGTFAVKAVLMANGTISRASYLTSGNPLDTAVLCLGNLLRDSGAAGSVSIGVTGMNAYLLTNKIGLQPLIDVESLCEGISYQQLECDCVLSLGHENMYYVELGDGGRVEFINRNGQCAAGSGAFWYQQATRMGLTASEMSQLALECSSPVRVSGRCAVFAKSDMTHAINEGATQAEVCAGLAKTLAEMIVKDVTKNRMPGRQRVLVVGGVAENRAVLKYLNEICKQHPAEICVPPGHQHLSALGALRRAKPVAMDVVQRILHATRGEYRPSACLPKLDPERVHYVRPPETNGQPRASSLIYLGVDCGSVSTKCVLIDSQGEMIGGVYLPTAGRPALQVLELMKQANERYGETLANARVIACTTGSGRFLSQKVLNAEYAVDEITCQAEAIKHLFPDERVLSIIEIGGEDSKFLHLSDGTLQDYNMNPVCAAGTGTFLENLAAILGVDIKQEFSEKAFLAEYAMDLGDRCTLLSQSALAVAASQGLPLSSQIASLAYSSARNYLSKTAERRPLTGKVVFTGATAKNHALVSAFAHEIGRDIHVPPYPELTGALGSALMAKKMHETKAPKEFTFRGIAHLNAFTPSTTKCSAQCEHGHTCNLHVLRFSDNSSFLYGDRCGQYSGLTKKALPRYEHIEDYVALRNDLFYRAAEEPLPEGTRVGIARGGGFFDIYPLWAGFFAGLGAQVVLSKHTSPGTLEEGKRHLDAEMCYPVEVLVGHYAELASQNVDYIFIPEVLDMQTLPWSKNSWRQSTVCPLLQTMYGTVMSSLGLPQSKVLHVELLDWLGDERKTARLLGPIAKRILGERYDERLLASAVREGYRRLARFRADLEAVSKPLVESLAKQANDDTIVACFIGRPYTIYDEDVSKRSLTYARSRGIYAIPQEYLLSYVQGWYEGRLESNLLGPKARFDAEVANLVNDCGNIYPVQLQRMIAAAFIVKYLNQRRHLTGLPLIHTVFQDPFRCGPNAMLRHFLSTLSNGLRLTMDEHTAPAGMVTRLEAFKNTCRGISAFTPPPVFSGKTISVRNLRGKRIMVPSPTEHSRVFVTMFRKSGVRAELLPRSADRAYTVARRYVNGEECLPFIQNMQDMLEYALNADADMSDTVFFQGWSCGPCRYGLYAPTQSLLLERAGLGKHKICSVKLEDLVLEFGLGFLVGLYDGLLAVDALYKLLHRTRPREVQKGESEALFLQCLDELASVLSRWRLNPAKLVRGTHITPITDLIKSASERFARIASKDERLPRVIVAGEFYVRLDDRCNQDVVLRIEKAGGEALLSPATEFFSHSFYREYKAAKKRLQWGGSTGDLATVLGYNALSRVMRRDELAIEAATHGFLTDNHEPDAIEIEAKANRYLSSNYDGEPPCTVGRTVAIAERGEADGAVFVAPFGCLPGAMVEAQVNRLRHDLGVPVVPIYYDVQDSPNTDEVIQGVVFQARQRLAR